MFNLLYSYLLTIILFKAVGRKKKYKTMGKPKCKLGNGSEVDKQAWKVDCSSTSLILFEKME